nr:helix-turn-helix transcriptional regulator [Anaerotruncus rubiinfantis]
MRKERGYKTQEELAAALRNNYNLKTDRAMVGKWEIGYQAPEMYTIKCLADLLGTTMDYLSGDEANQPTTVSSDGLDPLDKQLMDFVSTLTVDQKEFLLAQLQTMNRKKKENQSSPDR